MAEKEIEKKRSGYMNQNLEKQFKKLIKNNIHNDSFNTRKTYKQRFGQFLEFCSDRGIQSIHKIKSKTVADYVSIQLDNGVSETTLKATVSAIRYFIKMACEFKGTKPLFNLTNAQLGIATKREFVYKEGISENEYHRALGIAKDKNDKLALGALKLGYILGLRSNEIFNLRMYELRDAINNGKQIEIAHGTKGGRKRTVLFNSKHLDELKEIYNIAKASGKRMTDKVMTYNEKDACKKNLASWHNWWSRNSAKIADDGRNTPLSAHSLRRQYARNLFNSLLERGKTKETAANIVSNCLGHGSASVRKDITSIYLGFKL